jgi:hypothetical protein
VARFVELSEEALRRDLPVSVLDERGNLFPVHFNVEVNA